jgi:hypothetical protein
MKNIVKKVVIGVACVGCVFATQAKTTYRDSLGRKQGTAEVDRYGKTIYRDSLGRKQGTAETDRYGKTTYRDAQGRIQGTKK